ncbi:hypothetical protein AVEN_177815-1 [Araneus ventricosus]|uniref:Uncharacterized protein n=1 Tax=Araneus ventricosus TaxID=182803 RepID=A0A4Y2PZC4_ARAVE|nr:hypothetical protein AVEN_177815-1 [Araneus ventricosus]
MWKTLRFSNPLIPKTIGIEEPKNTGTPEFLFQRKGKFTSPSKTTMTASIVRILRKPHFSPNPSKKATLTKKKRTARMTQSHLTKGAGNFAVILGRSGRPPSFT